MTLVPEESGIGQYKNGSYSGLLGLIQNKIIDFALQEYNAVAENDAFKLSPIVQEKTNRIYSFTKPSLKLDLDVLSSLNALSPSFWLYVIFACFCFYKIILWLNQPCSVIDIYAMIFEQHYPSYNVEKAQIFMTIFVFCLAFILEYFKAAISTNLSVTEYPPTIDTLVDIVYRNVTPLFGSQLNTHEIFENAEGGPKRAVWDRVLKIGKSKCLIGPKNLHRLLELVGKMFNGEIAILFAESKADFIFHSFCVSMMGKIEKYKNHDQEMHVAAPFSKSSVAYPLRNGLRHELDQRLQYIFYSMGETGLHWKFKQDFTAQLTAFCYNNALYHDCFLHLKYMSKLGDPYVDIGILHFRQPLVFICTMYAMSTLPLIFERWVRKRLSRNYFIFQRRM